MIDEDRTVPPRRLIPNVVMLLAGQLLSKGTTLIALFLLGHYLGDAPYGRWSVALAIPLSLDALGDLGLSIVLIRKGAGRPGVVRGLVADMLPVKLLLAGLLVAGTYGASAALGLSAEVAEVALFLGVAKALDSLTWFARSVFEASERMEYEAVSLVLDAVVRLGFVIYALAGGFGLVGIAKAYVLASAIVVVATWLIAGRRFLTGLRPRFAPRASLALVGLGLPLALVWFFEGLALRVDTILLGGALGDAAAGRFSAAARLVEPLLIVPLVMGMAMLPLVSRHLLEGRDTPSRLFRSGLHLGMVVAYAELLVLVGLAERILGTVFGPDFIEAAPVLRVLAFALIPLSARAILVNALTAHGSQHRLLLAQVAGNVVNVALALAVLRAFGEIGVAIAVFAGEIVTVAVAIAHLRGIVRVDLGDAARTLAAGAPAIAVLLVLERWLDPVVATGAALLALAAAVRALGVVNPEERAYFETVAPRFRGAVAMLLGPARP